MILLKLIRLLPAKRFELGKGCVTRYTLIEIRWLFSIYFHHIETFDQDRFHTHAFNAHVWILNGCYLDEIKDGIGPDKTTKLKTFSKGEYRYIPRTLNHKLKLAEENTISLLITGAYGDIWTEETDNGIVRILTKHHKPLGELKVHD